MGSSRIGGLRLGLRSWACCVDGCGWRGWCGGGLGDYVNVTVGGLFDFFAGFFVGARFGRRLGGAVGACAGVDVIFVFRHGGHCGDYRVQKSETAKEVGVIL